MAHRRRKPPLEPHEPVSAFLKWAGGKGRLVGQYQPYFPATLKGRGYVEPFVGSGAIFFYVLQHLKPDHCTLLDVNPDLINTWQQVRDNVEILLEWLAEHHARHNAPGISEAQRKEYYYAIRAQSPQDKVAQAARFIYLNKTCFNGLHRLNAQGQFNVPMGRYKNPRICAPAQLRAVSQLLKGVRLETCDFRECGNFIKDGDFVYFDPPYEPLSRTSNFTAYAKGGFTPQHQTELRDLLAQLGKRADCMLSNSTAPLIEALYDSPAFYKQHVLARRAINVVGKGRGKIHELLITTYSTAKPKDFRNRN